LSQSSFADFSARSFQAIIKNFGSSLSRAEPGLTPSLVTRVFSSKKIRLYAFLEKIRQVALCRTINTKTIKSTILLTRKQTLIKNLILVMILKRISLVIA
jgi:hypothetical protein